MTRETSDLHPAGAGRYFHRWLWVATLLANAFVMAVVGLAIMQSRQHAVEEATFLTENYSRILEQDLIGFLDKVDLTLLAVVDEIRRQKAAGGIDGKALDEFIGRLDRRIPEILGLRVVDAGGIVRHAVHNVEVPKVSIADRPMFIRLRDDPAAGLVFSKPLFGRAALKWMITVGRRIDNADGSFAGDVHMAIGVDHFISMFAKLDLGPKGNSGLWDPDTLIARYSKDDPEGARTGATTPSAQLKALLQSGSRSAVYQARSGIDGISRLYHFRRVGSYPLYMVVGLADDDYLAVWRKDAIQLAAMAALFLLATSFFSALVHATWHRRQQAAAALRDSEARFRQIFDSVSDAILIHDADSGRIIDINRRMCEMYGYSRAEAVALDTAQLGAPTPAGGGGTVADKLALVVREGPQTFECLARNRRGASFWTEISLGLANIGGQRRILAVVRDIGQRKAAEAQLRLAASVFASSYEGILIADAEQRITDVNPAFTRITGYPREEVLGLNPKLLSSGRQGPAFYEAMWQSLQERDFWRGEIWNRRRNGEVYAEMLSISALRDESGKVQHYIGVFSDISVFKKHEADLDRIAHYDALTGVPNRRLFDERLRQALERSHRSGGLLAVCYLDLDGFKPINDLHGHGTGDHLLVEITRRLQGQLRPDDTLARLGGDEFVLLLTGLDGTEECSGVLDRVLAAVALPVAVGDAPIAVTASIGVTLCPPDDPDADTLLRHADQAMYRAKEAGRNCYHLFDPEQDRLVKARRHKLARLRAALEDREFLLHYQPKVDLVSGEVIGAEALIRWQHPDDGLLLPAAFLQYISGTDLETLVGEWVIDAVLVQMARWRAAGYRFAVSVNISANHLLQPEFAERLRDTLRLHATVPPGDLELEILETAALSDIEGATRAIAACRQLGVRFALDDFGTGYSSLAYFRKLPVDILKIDQSFVQNMLEDPTDLDIVESVVRLAEAFKRPVIAEGVETIEHGALLVSIGCRQCQGDGISPALPVAEFERWLEAWPAMGEWFAADRRVAGRDNLPLMVAAQSHRRWLKNVVDHLDAPNPQTIADLAPDDCRFGRWYRSGGAARYGRFAEFEAIGPLHERVHVLADEMFKLAGVAGAETARARLPGLETACAALLGSIETLIRRISAEPASGTGDPA